jgi:fumarate reductase flavoprotein subunit
MKRHVATKSVIVATGGFSANSQMVVKYRPDLEGFVTTNHKGATGGGIALLERIGAGTVDMGEIQIHPTVEQKTSYLISESIRGGGAILVNQKGNRFFNEMETRDKVSAQIIALPEKYAYIVFDEHVRAKNKAADEYIAKGFVTSASSPKALAENWEWIITLSWQRWNVTTALLKNSTMMILVVPPRCVRQSMKGRSTPFRLRRACTTPWAA